MKQTTHIKVMVLNNDNFSYLGGDILGHVPAKIGMMTHWGVIYKISKSGKTVYTISKIYGKQRFNKRSKGGITANSDCLNCGDFNNIEGYSDWK